MPAFLGWVGGVGGGAGLPKFRNVWGPVSPILILLQTLFFHPIVKQIHDRWQLIKVGAVTQSYLWVLL